MNLHARSEEEERRKRKEQRQEEEQVMLGPDMSAIGSAKLALVASPLASRDPKEKKDEVVALEEKKDESGRAKEEPGKSKEERGKLLEEGWLLGADSSMRLSSILEGDSDMEETKADKQEDAALDEGSPPVV